MTLHFWDPGILYLDPNYLVVQPIWKKYANVKMGIFPQYLGVKIKEVCENHHLEKIVSQNGGEQWWWIPC